MHHPDSTPKTRCDATLTTGVVVAVVVWAVVAGVAGVAGVAAVEGAARVRATGMRADFGALRVVTMFFFASASLRK
jgi:hypothetical protein